jgi:hypothetical protein
VVYYDCVHLLKKKINPVKQNGKLLDAGEEVDVE